MMHVPQPAADAEPQRIDHGLPGLLVCEQLLARHLDAVVRRFGAVAFGVIDLPSLDLPSLGSEPLIPAQVRAAAALLWCRELELAGLLPVVEALADAVERGEDALVLGADAVLLRPFGRRGSDRVTAVERQASYARLFERAAGGFDFEGSLHQLLRSLDALARASPRESLDPLQLRVAMHALELGRVLSMRAVGMTAFVARDIVAQIRAAQTLLSKPEIAGALGGGPIASIVERCGPRLLGRPLRYLHHRERARLLVDVIAWIADAADQLDSKARSLGPGHPVVSAASMLLAMEVRA